LTQVNNCGYIENRWKWVGAEVRSQIRRWLLQKELVVWNTVLTNSEEDKM
jgi:hypothetical protein